MIAVFMGEDKAVYSRDSCAQQLVSKIGTGINNQAEAFHFNVNGCTQPFVFRIIRQTNRRSTTYGWYAL
jgi:hypothetical protein